MKNQPSVVLIGDSLVIDVVEAYLQNTPSIAATRLSRTNPDFCQQLDSLPCGLIILDLYGADLPALADYLINQRQVAIVMVNADSGDTVFMCSQSFKLNNVDDLIDVIIAITNGQETTI